MNAEAQQAALQATVATLRREREKGAQEEPRKFQELESLLQEARKGRVDVEAELIATRDRAARLESDLVAQFAGARQARLAAAYAFFDFDGDGKIGIGEFFEIGKALQGSGWDERRNREAFATLDTDGSGRVDQNEFLFFYEKALKSQSEAEFDNGINSFTAAAKRLCLAKVARLEEAVRQAQQYKVTVERKANSRVGDAQHDYEVLQQHAAAQEEAFATVAEGMKARQRELEEGTETLQRELATAEAKLAAGLVALDDSQAALGVLLQQKLELQLEVPCVMGVYQCMPHTSLC